MCAIFLALSSCSSSDEELDEDTPQTESPLTPAISFEDLQDQWLWTAEYNPMDRYLHGTWEDSYCEIAEDRILFYHHEIHVNLNTGESTSVRVMDEQYPLTFSAPNILRFNHQDFRVIEYEDGYKIESDIKGYVLRRLN